VLKKYTFETAEGLGTKVKVYAHSRTEAESKAEELTGWKSGSLNFKEIEEILEPMGAATEVVLPEIPVVKNPAAQPEKSEKAPVKGGKGGKGKK